MMSQPETRIRTLDLIRGVAVLGILAVNITSFAAPTSANYAPDMPNPGGLADHILFGIKLLFFEGKMRALFSMLFGVSLLLFIDRASHAGRDGVALQVRRLCWLALFGYLHFLLLWSGDILFIYAVSGLAALVFRRASPKSMIVSALLIFTVWQSWNYSQWQSDLSAESAMVASTASPAQTKSNAENAIFFRQQDSDDLAVNNNSWSGLVAYKLREKAYMPLIGVFFVMGETLTYILFGMALLNSGFFAGAWRPARLRALAGGGIGVGGLATLAFIGWNVRHNYPPIEMRFAIDYGLSFAHLAMALGYLALLVLLAARLLATRIGCRVEATGRMAFSNYIGTSLVMTGIFYGWGLGLFGQFGEAARHGFVLLGWILMLAWSQPWLTRYRQGPLEWLWRSLTEWRVLPPRR